MYQQPINEESFQSCGKGRHTAYLSRDHEYAFPFRGNGSFLAGEKVTGKVGGDLNIESKKDSKGYESKSASSGLGISYNPASGGVSVTGGASKGSIESRYDSVTSQSGIYAGKEGFDINVEKNTDLKGAVIDSKAPAEKNQLTTGTLTWEDTKNKAEYEMKEKGLSYNHYGDYDNMSKDQKDDVFNKKGLTPVLPTGSSDKAESTTKSAVAEGTITIKDKEHQKQDIAELNRNMTNNLNQLGEIFDKDDVKERQELAGLFIQEAMGQLHYWNPDSAEGKALKAMAHGIVGEIAARIAGNQAGSGFYATMTNEALIGEIRKIAEKDPALAQWISAMIGSAVNKGVGKDAQVGGSTAQAGTKWNLELNPMEVDIRSKLNDKIIENLQGIIRESVDGEPDNQLSEEECEKLKSRIEGYASHDGTFPVSHEIYSYGLYRDTGNDDYVILDDNMIEWKESSSINEALRNSVGFKRSVLEAIRDSGEMFSSGNRNTFEYSSSIGWDSIDLALAIHGYTGVVTYEVQNDGRTIDATVTIYDVMNFERRDDFPFGIRQLNQDGYLAEENGILHPFGFKTTVHLTIDPLHVILW